MFMDATATYIDDWRHRLAALCDQRAELAMYRDSMETAIASLNEEIRAILTARDLLAVDVPGYRVTLVTTRRPTLSAERLLELGVGTNILEEATKTSTSVSVRVTATDVS